MKNTIRFAGLASVVLASAVSFGQVALQNASATFSQTFNGPWNASQMIDGSFVNDNGWAVFDGGTSAQTAVFETVSDLTTSGLQIAMTQNYATFPGHFVGRFRWSATTDDRSTFADGLQTGGDVTANWTVLTPAGISAPGLGSTILGDGSILMSYTAGVPATALYTVDFATALTGVTGLRLEVLEDPSLPTSGPGMHPSNGNFVLTEVEVQAVPEPVTMVAMAAGAALIARRRKKS